MEMLGWLGWVRHSCRRRRRRCGGRGRGSMACWRSCCGITDGGVRRVWREVREVRGMRGRTVERAAGERRQRRSPGGRADDVRGLVRERDSWKRRHRRDGRCRRVRGRGERIHPRWEAERGDTEGEGSCVPLKTSAAPMDPSIS